MHRFRLITHSTHMFSGRLIGPGVSLFYLPHKSQPTTTVGLAPDYQFSYTTTTIQQDGIVHSSLEHQNTSHSNDRSTTDQTLQRTDNPTSYAKAQKQVHVLDFDADKSVRDSQLRQTGNFSNSGHPQAHRRTQTSAANIELR